MAWVRFLLILVCAALSGSEANAATVNVVGGQLVGASGVDVDGTLYDVEFVDGSCVDLFSGCDESSDFTFTTESDALAASQALLDQVFLDGLGGNFDSAPELTNGCTTGTLSFCDATTPFGLNEAGFGLIDTADARNDSTDTLDLIQVSILAGSSSTSAADFQVYAVWTAVPEPTTALLLSTAFLALAGRKQRDASSCRGASR